MIKLASVLVVARWSVLFTLLFAQEIIHGQSTCPHSPTVTQYSDYASWRGPAKVANGAESGSGGFDEIPSRGIYPSIVLYNVQFLGIAKALPTDNPSVTDWGSGATITGGFNNGFEIAMSVIGSPTIKAFGLDLMGVTSPPLQYGERVHVAINGVDGTSSCFDVNTSTTKGQHTFVGFVSDRRIGTVTFGPEGLNAFGGTNGQVLADNLTIPGAPGSYQQNGIPFGASSPTSPEMCAGRFLWFPIRCTTITYKTAPNRALQSLWYDPPSASAYDFQTTDGSHFLSIDDFPTLLGDSFQVVAGGQVLGTFGPGQSVNFPGGGVSEFTIYGGSGDGTQSFPLKLTFDRDAASFQEIAALQCPALSSFYLGTGSQSGQLSVSVSGSCPWSATSNANWITVVSGSSGTGSGVVQMSIAANTGLMRTGTVTIGGRTLTVIQAGTDTKPPFGHIDTPVNDSTGQAGGIGFTGWALSPITIANLALCREVLPGEPGINGLVYVGNAVLVPGVRPDVAATFPGYPNNNWGWGAQILTNELPGTNGLPLGNGTYKLHAIAADAQAPAATHDSRDCACTQSFCADLGTTTISSDNAHSILPFGTIDTPGQGQTISGTDFVNFGWVVTPQPNIVPIDASTITVYIDNVSVGHPVYNQIRSDIVLIFPGLRNTNGAVGFFHIDSTKLSNGIHSIAWGVTDSAGNAAGVGSRYFFVQN